MEKQLSMFGNTQPLQQRAPGQSMSPLPTTIASSSTIPSGSQESNTPEPPAKPRRSRWVALALLLLLGILLYLLWRPSSAETTSSGVVIQNNGVSVTTHTSASTAGSIQVYIVGAIKHPGVYTLSANARVYDLLQAAGGPLPQANLVAINLAAKLNDGQEVYVLATNETPPSYQGGVPGPDTGGNSTGTLVNINTASTEELRQRLHISAITAQNIVNFRLQHGPFTSVDQLTQVVSRAIYTKIKDLITLQ